MTDLLRPSAGRESQHPNERAECRICRDEDSQEELLTPCLCSGSMAHIHYMCMVKSIESRNSAKCDICLASFRDIEICTLEPTFGEFLTHNPEFKTELIFAILMALLLKASLFCQVFKAPQESCLWLQASVLVGFIAFYTCYMLFWFQDWMEENMRVKVINKRGAN